MIMNIKTKEIKPDSSVLDPSRTCLTHILAECLLHKLTKFGNIKINFWRGGEAETNILLLYSFITKYVAHCSLLKENFKSFLGCFAEEFGSS